jgi:hypothetical protein
MIVVEYDIADGRIRQKARSKRTIQVKLDRIITSTEIFKTPTNGRTLMHRKSDVFLPKSCVRQHNLHVQKRDKSYLTRP